MIRHWVDALAIALVFSAAAPAAAQGVAGRWLFDVTLDAGSGQATFELQLEGSNLTGTYGGVLGEHPITGTVEGHVTFIGRRAS